MRDASRLGYIECVRYEAIHVDVRHGDRNVLYTDVSLNARARSHAWCTSLNLVAVRGGLGETPVKFTWEIPKCPKVIGHFVKSE